MHYARGEDTTDQRLSQMRSIGFGGHVSMEDIPINTKNTSNVDFNLRSKFYEDIIINAVRRELEEELGLTDEHFLNSTIKINQSLINLINKTNNPVNDVHLGVWVEINFKDESIMEDIIHNSEVADVRLDYFKDLDKYTFEEWSKFILLNKTK